MNLRGGCTAVCSSSLRRMYTILSHGSKVILNLGRGGGASGVSVSGFQAFYESENGNQQSKEILYNNSSQHDPLRMNLDAKYFLPASVVVWNLLSYQHKLHCCCNGKRISSQEWQLGFGEHRAVD